MKIAVYPADQNGCGYYRLIFPAHVLQKQGHDVEIIMSGTMMENATIQQPHEDDYGQWEIKEGQIPDADVVVIQRPSHPAVEALMRYVKRRGIQVVVDMDDRFDAIPHDNMAWGYYRGSNMTHMKRCLDAATVITCSTPELAKLHGGILIENCVPERYLQISDNHENLVGWSGSMSVHGSDLRVAGGLMSQVINNSDWKFHIVGVGDGVKDALSLRDEPTETGWLDIADYPEEVAKLGIGIAPLADNRFNRSKSWLKALEYSALGIPFVASDLPEYRRFGVGLLASNPRQWKGMLASLLNDEARRDDMRLAGRETASRWTYEGNANRWLEVWANPEQAAKTLKKTTSS